MAAIVSPTLVFGLLSLGFYTNLHLKAAAKPSTTMPLLEAPKAGQRLLIIAPHCDDETLGAGGLIAQARQAGVPVQLVFLTNGDAFPAACALVTRKLPPKALDYVHLGELRQKEALAAAQQLGVAANHVTFLGYPDRGIQALWETHWTPEQPYVSRYTQRSATPRGPYCGQNVLKDLEAVLESFHPTDVYVTHPLDDHSDHSISAAFTQMAVAEQAKPPRLHYYIIHRGDWPLPQGYSPTRTLTSPAGFSRADTHWRTRPLSPQDLRTKEKALNQYRSQLELCGRQLRSFLRANEIFGQLHPTVLPGGDTALMPDAQGDDVVRFANPSTDISGLSVQVRGETLNIMVQLRGLSNPSVRYGLRVRGSNGSFLAQTLHPPSLPQVGSSTLTCTVPLTAVRNKESSESSMWIAADTGMTSRYIVDQTGYRQVRLGSSPPSQR